MHSFQRTYVFPFKGVVPNFIENHLNQVNFFKRYLKFLRRYLYVFLKGQRQLETFKILPEHQKILWINISAPSLGDSLMDLSSRAMLKDKALDLFTDKKNSHIYENDIYFNNVFTREKDVDGTVYDLIIIDSYSSRSIKVKSLLARKTRFVGVYGYFNGPEVNRILFSFYQMNFLLNNIKSEDQINRIASNSISISKQDQEFVDQILPKKYISFVLGGEWSYKTYHMWDEVISKLLEDDNQLKIIFLGSRNALSISREISIKFPESNVFNFVDKLSFNQTAEVIKRSQFLFCCDGGLMHAANAVNTLNLALMARLTPEMLLPKKGNFYSLFDEKNVNNIQSMSILSTYYKITKKSNIYS
jgi:ADP-heptose:LPS heptosyltransferase